jgi:hypothetical protein
LRCVVAVSCFAVLPGLCTQNTSVGAQAIIACYSRQTMHTASASTFHT